MPEKEIEKHILAPITKLNCLYQEIKLKRFGAQIFDAATGKLNLC